MFLIIKNLKLALSTTIQVAMGTLGAAIILQFLYMGAMTVAI